MNSDKRYKIYTRTGDRGTTALLRGERVGKEDLRIEVCGDLDELNAQLGCLLTYDLPEEDRSLLKDVQNRLFDFGVLVSACPSCGVLEELPESVSMLEYAIDSIQEQVPMPGGFILPTGVAGAAQCHVCRTVCRRAERHLCGLYASDWQQTGVLPYINRLSDYLYALSIKINFIGGYVENLWQKRCRFEK